MKSFYSASVFLAICLLTAFAFGQKNISIGSPVSENFDSIGSSNISLADNIQPGLTGFYSLRSTGNATPQPFTASNGTIGTAGFFNLGLNANTNRALGWVTGNGLTTSLGLRLRNNGATPIAAIRIQFAGEQWRDGNGSAETMTFAYQVGATVTSLSAGTYTAVPALTFTSPNAAPGANIWNGDLPANRVVFDQTISVTIPAGQEIMLRWSSLGTSAQGDGIGVDDITITAIGPTAAKASISGRVTDAYGRAISNATITTTDLSGTSVSVYTNTFGYFSVNDLEVGQAYVLSISSRRYTFANPTRLIDLSDNIDNLDFVANR